MALEAGVEGRVILIIRIAPQDFAEGAGAGQGHIFDAIGGRHVFGPELALATEDMAGFFGVSSAGMGSKS